MVASLAGLGSVAGAGGTDEAAYLREGGYSRVIISDGLEVHGSTINGLLTFKNNLIVGHGNTVEGGESKSNIVLGTNVVVGAGVVGSVSIGRNDVVIQESGMFYLGDFAEYRRNEGVLDILDGAVRADLGEGRVQLGRGKDVEVTEAGTTIKYPMTLTHRDPATDSSWKFTMEPSENGPTGHDLVITSNNNTSMMISETFVPSVTNFTGQHRCIIRGAVPPVGSVLVATGEHIALDGTGVQIDEAIPVVTTSDVREDKRAFGVMSSLEDVGASRHVQIGNIVFVQHKDVEERRVIVNGCGEGGILVCGEGGDIENGDYLCSSSRPGVAMKQACTLQRNYTCAKATAAAAFRGREEVLIGCVYHF